LDSDKTYFVTAKLGQRTDTSDADGEVVETREVNVTREQILEHKVALTGDIKQVPTMFSALKYQGQPLYKLARQGITVEREARPITVFKFELLRFEGDEADFEVHCSKGTYVRTLVDDLGQMLGCGAHVKVLRRTKVAGYPSEKMLTLEQIQALKDDNMDEQGTVDYAELDAQLLPMQTALQGLPEIELPLKDVTTLRFGQQVETDKDDLAQAILFEKESGDFAGTIVIEDGLIKVGRLVVKAAD